MPRLRYERRDTGSGEPDPATGIFYREPQGERQRHRWIAILEVAHRHAVTSMEQFRHLVAEAGHPVGPTQFARDIDHLRIVKHDGVYMQVSPDGDVELMAALRQRLMAVCHKIEAYPPNLVTLTVNRGAAGWVAEVIKEVIEEHPVSVMHQDDTVWLAVPDGYADEVAATYVRRWRGVDVAS